MALGEYAIFQPDLLFLFHYFGGSSTGIQSGDTLHQCEVTRPCVHFYFMS